MIHLQKTLVDLEKDYAEKSSVHKKDLRDEKENVPHDVRCEMRDSKVPTGKANRVSKADHRALVLAKQAVNRQQQRIAGLQRELDVAVNKRKQLNEVVRLVMDTLQAGGEKGTFGLSGELLAELKQEASDESVLGALYKRELTKVSSNEPFSPILLQFALSVANVSTSAYKQVRARIPGLPCMATVVKVRNSAAFISGSMEMRLRVFSEQRSSRNLTAWNCTGSILIDEVSIQSVSANNFTEIRIDTSPFCIAFEQGLVYSRKSGEFIGFVDENPLDVAFKVNSPDTKIEEIATHLATHCNMWFFLSYDRSVALVIHPEFTAETDKFKPYAMALLLNRVIGSLAMRGYTVTSVVTDSHQSNIVSTVTIANTSTTVYPRRAYRYFTICTRQMRVNYLRRTTTSLI